MVIVSVAVLLFCLLRRKKQGSTNNSVKPQNETMSYAPANDGYGDSSLRLESRRFTYKELEMITNNFQRVLGQGGFGYVYDGFLEDGTQVAVKLRAHLSNQGVKEFLAETQNLTRIHHKNLVSMIGYCKDGQYMALVYEYMLEGTLKEHIAGNGRNKGFLSWRQRLRIAHESAQGLEYLHNGCNPPLIHRDVKVTNILLNARLDAKIADFGLSKAFNRDNDTHVSTNTLAGTPGYVDPEYQAAMQPTTKNDVYSFGVVLNWLRDGAVPALAEADCRQLLREAEYYRMHGLIDYMNERIGEEKKVDGSPEAELTRKDVVRCIQAEKVRFRGVNLSGVNLSKLDLSEVDFSCGCLKKTDFSHANLQKAKFGEVEASRSSFQYANLRECEFVGANLDESILDRANLQSANLQDACLTKCSFIETDLRSAHLQSANLTGANLAGANLEGANLKVKYPSCKKAQE